MNSPLVSTAIHDGWIAVESGSIHLIVAASEERRASLETAARDGLVPLLEALGERLGDLPDFAIADTSQTPIRVLMRGAAWAQVGDSVGRSLGRMPWREFEVPTGVTLHGPEPVAGSGWQRPSRFSVAPTAAVESEQSVDAVPEDVPSSPEVEAAASRAQAALGGAPEQEQSAPPEPESHTTSEPEPTPTPEAAPEPTPEPPPTDLTLPPPADGEARPPVERVAPTPPPSSAVIDSVPWRATSTPPAEPPPPPIYQTPVEAVSPPPPPPPPPPTGPPLPGPPPPDVAPPEAAPVDAPVAVDEPASELTTDRASLAPQADATAGAEGPIVLAVLCPAGHASSPHSGSCRVCGRDIPPQQPFQTPRPRLGQLRISTGGVVPLDRGVLLGRAPRVNSDLPPNARPHLVRLGSVDNDISRNHAEVVLEGWHVLVRDLGSTNGTTIALPGQEPVRLRPTEDQGIEPGTVISLADEVTLVYEVDA